MNYRLFIGLISLLSFLGIVFGLTVICGPDENNVCRGVSSDYTAPVFGTSLLLFLTSLLLFFVSSRTFKIWAIFTPFWLFLSGFLIYRAPVISRDFIMPFDK